jgi:glycosyltransferase involved in cell wall biosynthesis
MVIVHIKRKTMETDDVVVLMMITYNRLELTKKTLELLDNRTKSNFRLVVVDNGSTDGTVEYLKKMRLAYAMWPCLKIMDLILLSENKGIAIGRNIALKKADELNAKWYCTLDNDVEMPDGWLDECIDILEKNKSYGAIGVNFEGKQYSLIEKNGCKFQDKPAGNLGTANMVFRKQLHQMIGFFNTEYGRLYGLEDSDFGMRARAAGFKLGYIERMGIHLGDDSGEDSEYRRFKTKQHDEMVDVFKKNCGLYMNGKKPIYIPFKE